MIFLDAYALIAFLIREPPHAEVGELLHGGAAMGVVNLAEVADRCRRVERMPEEEVRDALHTLHTSRRLVVVPADFETAWRAAAIRAEHYRRRASELSLADCFLLASARPGEDAIATSDLPVAAAARALGIELVALPDAAGRRP